MTISRRSALGCLRIIRGNSTLSWTVMWGKRAKFWKTMPSSRLWVGTSVTSSPSMKTCPSSGVRWPVIQRRAVVLPQPDGPSRVISSPRRMPRLIWSLATMGP